MVGMVLLECTAEKWNSQCDACFACVAQSQLWLAVNHNTSVTSVKLVLCSKRIARANELGSCQSLCLS